ncbi:hypothetical protein HYX08_07280 [Candidatus Woesearchaeota archaeon]|nr:hypothetical protein [Candidatus Woesearchaeota archaeon]
MKKEIFDRMKKELLNIAALLVLFIVIFWIMFYRGGFISAARAVLALFWLFALPGYFLTLYWHEKLDFAERFVIGIAVSLAVAGIASYYLGVFGLDIKHHIVILPLILILMGAIINLRK